MVAVPQACRYCQTSTMPEAMAVGFESPYGEYFVRLWRYRCAGCGWIWADAAQRAHNAAERDRRYAKFTVRSIYSG